MFNSTPTPETPVEAYALLGFDAAPPAGLTSAEAYHRADALICAATPAALPHNDWANQGMHERMTIVYVADGAFDERDLDPATQG